MYNIVKQNSKFRIFLGYQFFSSIGGAMFSMFILLSMHIIYQNPIYTGVAGFLMAAPHMISFAIGPIIDRSNKVSIIRLTTLLEFVVLSLLSFTPLMEQLGVWFMFCIVFAYSIASLFENPSATAFLPQIVEGEELLQANSIITIVSMGGGLIIAVVLFSSLAGDIDFRFLYGFSAVFVGLAFLCSMFLRAKASEKKLEETEKQNYLQDLKSGAAFISKNILLFTIMATVVTAFTSEMAYVLRPMFLEYHVGAQNYILFVVMGLMGGIAASSLVGTTGNKYKLGRLVFVLFILAGIARVAFALTVPVQLISGLVSAVAFAVVANTRAIIFSSLIQKLSPKDMVGRVGTMESTFTAIATTLGALAGGFLGNIVPDVGYIYIGQGIIYVGLAVFLILVPSVRKLPKMNEIV